jgi:hypothetical protein
MVNDGVTVDLVLLGQLIDGNPFSVPGEESLSLGSSEPPVPLVGGSEC